MRKSMDTKLSDSDLEAFYQDLSSCFYMEVIDIVCGNSRKDVDAIFEKAAQHIVPPGQQ